MMSTTASITAAMPSEDFQKSSFARPAKQAVEDVSVGVKNSWLGKEAYIARLVLMTLVVGVLSSVYTLIMVGPMKVIGGSLVGASFAIYGPIILGILVGVGYFFSVSSKRLHDLGQSELWLVLFVIPATIPFLMSYLLFASSANNENEYGPVPAGPLPWELKLYYLALTVVAILVAGFFYLVSTVFI